MINAARFRRRWSRLWMRYAHNRLFGKMATRMAGMVVPPYLGRVPLSRLHQRGYRAPSASISHSDVHLGAHCFLGENVLIYGDAGGGRVVLGDRVHLHRDTVIQVGSGGYVTIGCDTHIQPRCQISAYVGSVTIGDRVEIAPTCAFYPYNHGIDGGKSVQQQPLRSVGGITVEDDVWMGWGAIALDGVRIGRGAVVGAGAVVVKDIPAQAIAVGVPAQVVGMRSVEMKAGEGENKVGVSRLSRVGGIHSK